MMKNANARRKSSGLLILSPPLRVKRKDNLHVTGFDEVEYIQQSGISKFSTASKENRDWINQDRLGTEFDQKFSSCSQSEIMKPSPTVDILSNLIVGQPLGHGKFGNVYLAKHKESREQFALKVITSTMPNAIFLREIDIHSKLEHVNIAKLHW